MKGFAILTALVLSASPVLAQAAAQPANPTPPPRPAPAAPARPAPSQPAQSAPAQPSPQPPAPFPQGSKVAFVNLQAIAQLSTDGKAANAKVQALAQKKQTEGADKAKLLQANQQKLQTSGSVMSEQARGQLEKDIERQTVEGQRFEQDAQAELTELQQELQQEFQRKLMPILEQLSKEKGLQVLLSAADSGVIWADPGLDLTLEAVKKMDAAATSKPAAPTAAAPSPAPAPAAAPPAAAPPAAPAPK
jgi:Skp family chaperone for outer membrane proteins